MSDSAPIIRPAEVCDAAALAALDARSNPHPWTAAQFQAALAQPCDTVLLAEDGGGRLLGFIVWRRVADEMELHLIAAAPECRRQGIASALLRKMFQAAREACVARLCLEVRAGNAAAQALYAKHGFCTIAVRKRYYDGTEDALIMEKIC